MSAWTRGIARQVEEILEPADRVHEQQDAAIRAARAALNEVIYLTRHSGSLVEICAAARLGISRMDEVLGERIIYATVDAELERLGLVGSGR